MPSSRLVLKRNIRFEKSWKHTRYPLRPCLQGGRVTLVLGLHLQEGYYSTRTFRIFLRDVFTRQEGLS